MKQAQQAPDWAVMIEQMTGKGLTFSDIAKATQSVLTDRMVKHYASGVQPLHWRGEAMINLWCATLKAGRDKLPTCEIIRGHRVVRGHENQAPKLQSLPNWPPSPAASVSPVKRKYTRRAVEV